MLSSQWSVVVMLMGAFPVFKGSGTEGTGVVGSGVADDGTAGASGSSMTAGVTASGGALPGSAGAPTVGGQSSTAGETSAGLVAPWPVDDGGRACALPRSRSRTLPFARFATAAGAAWFRARARSNAS